jgi:hypothetical protein
MMEVRRSTVRGLIGVGLLGLGLGAGPGVVQAAAADTTATVGCVQPDSSVFVFTRVAPQTYRVSLRNPGSVTCSAVTFNVGSYTIPETWDRNGWNPTALPQMEFDYAALTFPAGGTEAVTATVSVPACGPYQTDLYTGPRLTTLQWPSPMGENRITGTMRDQAACASSSPAPTTTTPVATVPAASSPTPASTQPSTPATSSVAAAASSTAVSTTSAATSATSAGVSPGSSSSPPDTEVLGTKSGRLPHTGGVPIPLLVLGAGLLLLGAALVSDLPWKAPAGTRGRRH